MGNCISGPAKTGYFHRHKDLKPLQEYDSDKAQKALAIRKFSVINRPSSYDIFKKYQFGNELGRGEFGVTHKCIELETGDTFACKTISKSKLQTQIDVEDVRREVDIMRHLPKHPNIVAFKEAYEDKEAVYLVMELCNGGELFDRIISRGHYCERAAADVLKIIIDVCRVCHEHGVIHRDLKPENFLFADTSDTSQLKAIDFGLSIFFEPGQRFSEIVGSPYYMAPEVLRRNYGSEVDVWSAGVILYILLCGVPPFWAETEEGIAHAIIRGNIDFERDPWPKISDQAKDLVTSMLDPNPYSRITVQEVLEHTWIKDANHISTVSLGENVRMRIKQFTLMNRFKKKVLRVVADNLPPDQINGIKQLFRMMDTDKNGKLSFEELKEGLHKIGHPVPDPDVQLLMDAADVDGSGTLDSQEFLTISVHLKKIDNDDLLTEAFGYFDKNRSGYIESDELREALLENDLGPDNDQVIQDIISDVDSDKDGKISYDEFTAMMKSGMNWKLASRQYSRILLNALSIKMLKDKALQM